MNAAARGDELPIGAAMARPRVKRPTTSVRLSGMALRSGSSLLLTAAALVLAANALAQTGLEGTYRLAVSHDRAEQIIGQAIERAVADMGPLRRRIAESRLKAKNPAVDSLAIDLNDRRARIRYGPDIFDIRRGHLGSLTTPDGETARARAELDGGRLIVDWYNDDGHRQDTFSQEGDTLRFSVRITSDRLPAPMRYQLRYRATGE